jgi:hypothetical protein
MASRVRFWSGLRAFARVLARFERVCKRFECSQALLRVCARREHAMCRIRVFGTNVHQTDCSHLSRAERDLAAFISFYFRNGIS